MPPPIKFLTKKFAVTNSALECAEIISKVISDLLNKPHKYVETKYGYQIKARKGLIYEPQLIEVNIIEKKGTLVYTVVQISFGITPKGFGKKSLKLTKELLENGLNEILDPILPDIKLIGIDEQNICLKCGKVNFPMAGFCVQCNAELQAPIKELEIREISSIVEDVGVLEEEEVLKKTVSEKTSIPRLMDTITDIIDGKIDPETLEEKEK
ncbi:MAG: hypothetical protein ACTSO9_08810 [Candidatus Helarchaeota archaeon]